MEVLRVLRNLRKNYTLTERELTLRKRLTYNNED